MKKSTKNDGANLNYGKSLIEYIIGKQNKIQNFGLEINKYIDKKNIIDLINITGNGFWKDLKHPEHAIKDWKKAAKYLIGFGEIHYRYWDKWLSITELEILWLIEAETLKIENIPDYLMSCRRTIAEETTEELEWHNVWKTWFGQKEALFDNNLADFYEFVLRFTKLQKSRLIEHMETLKSRLIERSITLNKTRKPKFDYSENLNLKTYDHIINLIENLLPLINTNKEYNFGYWKGGKFVYTGNGKTFVKVLYEISDGKVANYREYFDKIKDRFIFKSKSFKTHYYQQPYANTAKKTTGYEDELKTLLISLLK